MVLNFWPESANFCRSEVAQVSRVVRFGPIYCFVVTIAKAWQRIHNITKLLLLFILHLFGRITLLLTREGRRLARIW